jgi:transglutaminase-like putative cysteine protease
MSGSRAQRLSMTVRAMVATGLGVMPLGELFTNWGWLIDVWLAIAVVMVPAAILRTTRSPAVWHTWLGVLLLVPWLTARFAPDHAIAGFIPTGATWDDVTALIDQVREISKNGVAPVHAGPPVAFVLALIAGLLAAFVDLVAVVARRAALGGIPLLVIFTLSGAVPRHAVSWTLFAAAAAGFLLLLSVDADDTVHEWGRLIPREGAHRSRLTLAVSAPRIAAIAIALAVLLPLLAPSTGTNPLADALHGKHTGPGTGGFGAGGGISLDPFAALKGQLQRNHPQDLFTVTVDRPDAEPFYLRANVLATYTSRGWVAARHDIPEDVDSPILDTTPQTSADLPVQRFGAQVSISNLSDNPPVFAKPESIAGLSNASWSAVDQVVLGDRVGKGDQFSEQVAQPTPTLGQLAAAGFITNAFLQRWLDVPSDMPSRVTSLVNSIVQNASTPYARARALNDFFTDPKNGFIYSLDATQGDSGNDLADFLAIRRGYCQQFAGALGIMLRMAGVPARVVLGYTHARPSAAGTFKVTTDNAHAWVEAYFDGLGWIPFDPTPLAGTAGGATLQLAWAPHPTPSAGTGTQVSTAKPTPSATRSSGRTDAGAAATQHTGNSASAPDWLPWAGSVLGAALIALLVPGAARSMRRRRRLSAARRGDADALWDELSATAVDLGYVWSSARSPRQVYTWLESQLREPASLRTMAGAVERSRYAPSGVAAGPLVDELRDVESQLRHRRSRATRIRSRLLPASLGWRLPRGDRRH